MPTEGGIRGSLLHAVPVPLPVVRSPPLHPWDGDPWGPRSGRNGCSQPQWRPLRAQLGSPPHSRQEPTPATTGPPPLSPGFAPPLPRSLRVPSRSADPREHNWDRPPPTAIVISTRAAGVYPAPVRSRRVSSRSGHFREHYWDRFPPPPDRKPAPRRPVSPRRCHAPGTLPISSVHARVGAGCRSVGDVSGA